MSEIVSLLDLFEGKLSLTDILLQDIPILDGLRDAKIAKNERILQQTKK